MLSEIQLLKDEASYRNNEILTLHEIIRKNRQPSKIVISDITFTPASPATLEIGDKIRVELTYEVGGAGAVVISSGIGDLGVKKLRGRGRLSFNLILYEDVVNYGRKSLDGKYSIMDRISIHQHVQYLKIGGKKIFVDQDFENLNRVQVIPEVHQLLTIPVQYKVKIKN